MSTEMLYYTGVGSRKAPREVLAKAAVVSARLADLGWTLRSGGAPGFDSAVEHGAYDSKLFECYLPWDGFNGRRVDGANYLMWEPGAMEMAARYHPNWGALSRGGKALMARNSHQPLGRFLDNDPEQWSKFVLCWTPEGKGGGGTGQALRIASDPAYDIPIFDMALDPALDELAEFLKKFSSE